MIVGQQRWWTLAVVAVAGASLLAAAEKTGPKTARFADEPAFQDNFDAGWSKTQKDWRVASWKQNGTEMSPDRCADDGKGCLVQTVLAGEPYRGGSMQTAKDYPYGRWVARLKAASVPGVLNSMFTDDWENMATETADDGTKYEVDIELLTYTFGKKTGKVHLAVHVPGVKNAFVEDVPLEFNPSDDFHVWGIDLLPDRIVWHVDGKELRTWKCPPGQEPPDVGHEMFFNAWTKPSWIKGPPKEDARYLIDWVKFYPLARKAGKDDKADKKE